MTTVKNQYQYSEVLTNLFAAELVCIVMATRFQYCPIHPPYKFIITSQGTISMYHP